MAARTELVCAMMDFYRGDPRQIQHFTKVYAYSRWIAQMEGLDEEQRTLIESAALMHDIGIRIAREKYGSSAGSLQEKEGPPAAREMLTGLGGYSPEFIDRVCYIIGHHHTYTDIDGIDYRIIVEADFLVNFEEGNEPAGAMENVYRKIFCTESGRALFRRIFDYASGEDQARSQI